MRGKGEDGEGKGDGQSEGGKWERMRERERLVGSERDRIPVFSVLLHAVVLIEQGKSVLGFNVKTPCWIISLDFESHRMCRVVKR